MFQYTSIANFQAYKANLRAEEALVKKQEIIDEIFDFYATDCGNILFVGFSSFIFTQSLDNKFVVDITDDIADYLNSHTSYTRLSWQDLDQCKKKFDVIVAADEFFTYAVTDQDQRDLIQKISDVCSGYVITTLRDYKNQDYRDREFSIPVMIKNLESSILFLEVNDLSSTDRNCWQSSIYQINKDQTLMVHGPSDRRAMYFKQLATFSRDAGSSEFLVHKNLMYKGLCRKNYEHVITMRFENAIK